ncbi:glycosyltransferase family 4 protein [Flavobacterium sp.]|uniref:glycosyltransferase family 4 protein n=1 Tax=Flavobacterium sp. TaxID=239 RepID=UPI0039E3A1DC
MKILYITEQVHLHGGAEKILIQKLNYWAEVFGYEVMLITSEQKGKPACYPISGKVKHVDLNIGYVEGKSYFSPVNVKKFPKHYKLLQQQISSFNPDAVFLISLTWIRFALPYLAKGFNIYNEYHTSYYGFQLGYENASAVVKIKKKLAGLFIEFVENQYTNIVFLNQAEYDFYQRKNAVIIPNFFEANVPESSQPKQKQILSLGRMNYQKGYDLLIEAWAKIDNQIEDWTVKIFGNGSDKEALREQVKKHNFKNPLVVGDAISNVSEELLRSEFYVMSSRFETFPMVLLEALSHGLPVASFDCPTGPRSILTENEDAILAQPENPADLAQKMLQLINDENLRRQMGAKGHANVDRFRPALVMAKWDELIRRNANR